MRSRDAGERNPLRENLLWITTGQTQSTMQLTIAILFFIISQLRGKTFLISTLNKNPSNEDKIDHKQDVDVDKEKKVHPFSDAVAIGCTLYVSGKIGYDSGKLAEGFIPEVKLAMQKLMKTLKERKSSLDDVVKMNVYLTDIEKYEQFNKLYKTYFKDKFPARTLVQVVALPMGASVELEAVARHHDGEQCQ